MTRQQKRRLERQGEANIIEMNVNAFLHKKDGTYDICSLNMSGSDKTINSKNTLLYEITKEGWGHNAPAKLIFEYILLSKTYKHKQQYPGVFNTANDFEIHYYMKGADSDFPDDYSCRQMVVYPEGEFDNMRKRYETQARKDNMDVVVA